MEPKLNIFMSLPFCQNNDRNLAMENFMHTFSLHHIYDVNHLYFIVNARRDLFMYFLRDESAHHI